MLPILRPGHASLLASLHNEGEALRLQRSIEKLPRFLPNLALHRIQSLDEIGDEVFRIFDADRDAD